MLNEFIQIYNLILENGQYATNIWKYIKAYKNIQIYFSIGHVLQRNFQRYESKFSTRDLTIKIERFIKELLKTDFFNKTYPNNEKAIYGIFQIK